MVIRSDALPLGGHSFPVYSPLGNWPISPKGAECIESLVHETDKAHLIKRSGFISSMARFGGVNFTIAKRGGYRNKADCLVSLNSKSLSSAIMDGFESLRINLVELCMVLESGIQKNNSGQEKSL